MSKTIEIIDHTLGWIAERQHCETDFEALLSVIAKYPVVMLDFPSSGEKLGVFIRRYLPVRVETVPNADELVRIFNEGYSNVSIIWRHGQEGIQTLASFLDIAASFFKGVYLKLLCASSLDENILLDYLKLVDEYRLRGMIYCDDEGLLEPCDAFSRLCRLRQNALCELEFCAGNIHGLATATTFSAIRAGINRVHTSVGGVVPFSSAAMEETLMCAKHFLHIENADNTWNLASDCAALLQTVDVEIPLNKAIIGKDIFAHESGIHVDGIIKNPGLYESFEPGEVGLERRLVVGKHSGRKSVHMKLLQWGVDATEEITENLMQQVKRLASDQKHALADMQLKGLYDDYMQKNHGAELVLERGGQPCEILSLS